ncbi:MAG: ABC transporter permease [Myxococcales bacterium]|nr:ABC transporter permease [Myxococcales bacterium]
MSRASAPWRAAWFAPLVALVVLGVALSLARPDTFASPQNLATMARQTVVVGIAAVGMTLVIVHGGIDLSVGSTVALTTVVIASALRAGAGPFTAALAGIATATTAGLANGLMVARLRLPPFIVTLGTMSVLRGLAKGSPTSRRSTRTRAASTRSSRRARGCSRSCPRGCSSPCSSRPSRGSRSGTRAGVATCTRWARARRPPGSRASRSSVCACSCTCSPARCSGSRASWSSPRSPWAIPQTRWGSSSRSSPPSSSEALRSRAVRGASRARSSGPS